MTEQQQREACAELARRMGWLDFIAIDNEVLGLDPDTLRYIPVPDYFTDAAASRELVAWLAAQDDDDIHSFICFALESITGDCELGWEHLKSTGIKNKVIMTLLTAEPPVIARAACKALGIEVGE